jgi:hypothetical protein
MNVDIDSLTWAGEKVGFLEKICIPNHFGKIVPIDERFCFVIGGSSNLKMLDKTMKEPN